MCMMLDSEKVIPMDTVWRRILAKWRAATRAKRTSLRCEQLEDREIRAILAVGAVAGSAPTVTVFDASTNQVKFTLNPYDASFTGGVNVAVGDVNGDGIPDAITGTGVGGGPQVNVYSGVDGTLL